MVTTKNLKVSEVFTGTPKDLPELKSLDLKGYELEWIPENGYGKRMLEKNPFIYRVLKEDGEVKGYYLLVPLEVENLANVLTGEIKESGMVDYVVPYEKGYHYGLYIESLVVDIDSAEKSRYTKELLKDLKDCLIRLREDGIAVDGFGGIAVSEAGNRICERFGMDHIGEVVQEGTRYNAYRTDLETVIQNIEL